MIQLIARTIETAHTKNKWVGLCGEMAGDPLVTPLVIGLGLDEFSMALTSIPVVKQVIRKLELKKCPEIARAALGLPSTEAVKEYLRIYCLIAYNLTSIYWVVYHESLEAR